MTTAFSNPFRPINPFLAFDANPAEGDVAEAREVSYALVQSGPAVAAEEVESHLDAVEVKVTWGTQVLFVDHLEATAGKRFTIGEGGSFAVPGFDVATPVVDARADGTYAIIPDGASGIVSPRGEHPHTVKGGDEIALTEGMTVRIELEAVTIEIASVRAGKKYPVSLMTALASGAAAFIGLSFVGHAAIVASLAMFMPKMGADDADNINRDQILMMQKMLNASAERADEDQQQPEPGADSPQGGGSKAGEPHQGESGAAGTTKATATTGHMAFKGSDDHVRLSHKDELQMAREWGLIGMLNTSAPKTGPASPWANDTQLGQDADNKWGALYGQDANDVMGYGLGLWGTGEGGGGKGHGIGLDGIGDLVGGGGNGPGKWGIGRGDKDGIGIGHGPGKGTHITKAPILRQPTDIQTNGRLPPEVIQRIVRQNFGRFRMCYEAGLRNNPGLSGRVVTKFVIGRDGSVAQAADAGSDLPNQEVVGCIVRSFTTLSFPQPEGGIATVSYPLAMNPGE
jgi:hypothetical protein